MQKNDVIELKIEDMSMDGAGIGRYEGMIFFVKDTVIGDTVSARIMKLKKTYGYARLIAIQEASPSRVEPRCLSARACGGCQLQQLAYAEQLKFKQRKVRDSLIRIGGFDAAHMDGVMEPIVGMEEPFAYRNKAQHPIGTDADGEPVAGFFAGRTHHIVSNTDCALCTPVNKQALDAALWYMKTYHVSAYDEKTGKGLMRHVFLRVGFDSNEIMVCFVVNGTKLPDEAALIERLTKIPGMKSILLNVNQKNTNVILGDETRTLWGEPVITDALYVRNTKDFSRTDEKITYRISLHSFYQVNPMQTEKLYAIALEYAGLTGREIVWDLYCGIGTISLFLARHAKQVYGIESVPQAVRDAEENAKRNGIENAVFIAGKVEEVLQGVAGDGTDASAVQKPDVVVVDPPRKGCDAKCLETMLRLKPERIVYVSCDPATLARDLRILCDGGYEIGKIRAVDQFGQTVHVETVVMLSHKKPDSVINVKVEFGEGEGKVPLDNIAKRAEAYKLKERVTYKMIKEYIEAKYGFKVHTAYIAEVKRELGLPIYDAPNAVEELKQPRKHPTAEKVEAIKDALKYFEVIK